MKWDDYKKLSGEQREEWKFKFKDNVISLPFSFGAPIILYALSIMFMFAAYCLLQMEMFEGGVLRAHLLQLIIMGLRIVFCISLFMLVELIIWFGGFVWRIRKEKKWLLKVNIQRRTIK